MIIEYIIFGLGALIFLVTVGTAVGKYIKHANPEPDTDLPVKPLSEYRWREALTELLRMNRIIGDADIRGGEVFAAPNPDRAPVLSKMFLAAYQQAKADGMTAGSNVYFAVKNPGQGTGWTYRCFGDVGIGDAAEVAGMLAKQAVEIAELHLKIKFLESAGVSIVEDLEIEGQPVISPKGNALIGGGYRCTTCNGQGTVFDPKTQFRTRKSCDKCGGSGKVN